MTAKLFTAGDAPDAAYVNLRDSQESSASIYRDFAETLWVQYESFADENFLIEVRNDFNARFWEMYLTCTLLAYQDALGYTVSCPKPGPDVLLTYGDHRVWIEAIAATRGVPGLPDSLGFNQSTTIPEEKIVLRYTNAISEKHRRYKEYLSGIVSPKEAFVIALNGCRFADVDHRAAADVPRFLKAVYPLGTYQIQIDYETKQIIGAGNATRLEVLKSNSSSVSVESFLDSTYSGVSAILYSGACVAFANAPLGTDFELAYNSCAHNPLMDSIPASREWRAEDGKLVGRQNPTPL